MKNPDNMTAEELLRRIRSLEKKVADLRWQLRYAQERIDGLDAWAREAWTETRRCWALLTLRAKLKDDLAVPAIKVDDRVQVVRRKPDGTEDGRIGWVVELRSALLDTVAGESAFVVLDDLSKTWLRVTDLRKI